MGVNRPAGRMPAVWAIERLMDDAARELGFSPAQICRINFVKEFPYNSPLGGTLTDSNYVATMDKLLSVFRYEERQQEAERLRTAGRKVGVGLAACVELCRPLCSFGGALFYNQPQYASVSLRMYPDGSVSIMSGDAPQGQMRHTTMAKVTPRSRSRVHRSLYGRHPPQPGHQLNTDVTSVCAIAARRLRSKVIAAASHLMRVDANESNFVCEGALSPICRMAGR